MASRSIFTVCAARPDGPLNSTACPSSRARRGSSLCGGEDYEAVFTLFADLPGMLRIGRIVGRTSGWVFLSGDRLPVRGYDHFTSGKLKSLSIRVRD